MQYSRTARAVCATIREAAMTATDTLLVYFSGHGVLNDDLYLHLALTGTDGRTLLYRRKTTRSDTFTTLKTVVLTSDARLPGTRIEASPSSIGDGGRSWPGM